MFSVFLYFFRSDLIRLQLFRLWITLNAIIFSSLVNERLRFQLNIPSINLVSNQIYHRIDDMLLASSKYGKHQSGISFFPILKNEIVFVEFCFQPLLGGKLFKPFCLLLLFSFVSVFVVLVICFVFGLYC